MYLLKFIIVLNYCECITSISRLQYSDCRCSDNNRVSCIPAPSTSVVGAQRHCQTDASILEWAHHTNAARPSMAAVSGIHRLQAGCARLLMPAWSGATVSYWLHTACHRFQSSSSLQLAIWHTRQSTVGDHKFPVPRSLLWNSLSPDVTSVSTPTFFGTASKPTSFPDHFLSVCGF